MSCFRLRYVASWNLVSIVGLLISAIGNEPYVQYQDDVEKFLLRSRCYCHSFGNRFLSPKYERIPKCFVVLQVMNPFKTGKLVLFQVTYDRDWHFFEIMFFVIIGIFGVSNSVFRRSAISHTTILGSLRGFCCQVEPPGCCLQTETPGSIPCIRSCHPRNFDSWILLLQQVSEDRHD